jgi:deazaflavin-dependent oxidoreductase (nitroreductase family)
MLWGHSTRWLTPSVSMRDVPIPKAVARFNKHVTNHVTIHIATWAPGFAVVNHVGRRSHRRYRTPVNVFRNGERYNFALTYGRDADWVRNVVAAGSCEIETRRKQLRLVEPEIFTDPTCRVVPRPARWILRALRVSEFLSARR